MPDVLATLRDLHRFVKEAGGKADVARAAAKAGVVIEGRVLLDLTDEEVLKVAERLWATPSGAESVPVMSPEEQAEFDARIPF